MTDARGPLAARRGLGRTVFGLGVLALIFFAGSESSADDPNDDRPRAILAGDRSQSYLLSKAESSFRSGDVVAGVVAVRQLLDGPSDSFLPTDAGYVGVRASAASLLVRQSPAARQFHDSSQAAASAALLERARQGDLGSCLEAIRRFPSTAAAFEAVDRLAAHEFDRGRFGTAARLWAGLVTDPAQDRRVTSLVIAKAACALRLTGREADASVLLASVDGRTTSAVAAVTRLGSVRPLVSSPPGKSAHHLAAPVFPATWRVATADGPGGSAVRLWEEFRRNEGAALATPAEVLCFEDRLVVRGAVGLAAVDRLTGETLWRSESLQAGLPNPNRGGGADGRDAVVGAFERSLAGNATHGRLSTDGTRVFVIDGTASDVATADRAADSASVGGRNRLLAFEFGGAGGPPRSPVWEVGGAAGDTRFFLGPPTAEGDVLLALVEQKQCVFLIALSPDSGAELWRQPLAFVPRPAATDPIRSATGLQPIVIDGVAVCPTNAGFLVAVDLIRRSLMWGYAYSVGETAEGDHEAEPTATEDRLFGPSLLVRDGRVFTLPADAKRLHCVELETGRPLWSAGRGDAYYLGCVTDDVVLLVGGSRCRALGIDGGERWSRRVGRPAGTGVASAGRYLVPLENGRICQLDLESGHPTGFDFPRRPNDFRPIIAPGEIESRCWRPGNLYTNGAMLFSVGPAEVVAFPCAAHVLDTAAGPTLGALERGRLELACGRLDAAEATLRSAGDGAEAAALLRELYFLRLIGEEPQAVAATLKALEPLCDSPAERGRFLLHATELDAASGHTESLRGRIAEFADLDLASLLPAPADETHLVSAASWASEVSPGAEAVLETSAGRRRSDAALLRSLPGVAEGDGLRIELADRAAADGNVQRAETLLLQAADGPAAEAAVRRLDAIWGGASPGLCEAAVPVGVPKAVPARVRIDGRLWRPADAAVCAAFGRSRRPFPTRGEMPFRLVDRGDSQEARVAVLDLESGACVGEVPLAPRLRFPSLGRQPKLGHLFPVATVGKVYGVSLLEAGGGEPVWTTELPGADSGVLPQVGPYGPSFCTVQTRRELTVIDPVTGQPLWRRVELPAEGGLHGSHLVGLFGDENVLTFLGPDGASYTVYGTATGREASQGRIMADQRRPRQAVGRKLFYVEPDGDRSTAKLWDPLDGRTVFAAAVEGKLLQTMTREDELALLFEGAGSCCSGRTPNGRSST